LASFFLCIFKVLCTLNLSCLTFSDLLQIYLRLISVWLDLPKSGRFSITCIEDFTNFRRSNFMISHFKKQERNTVPFCKRRSYYGGLPNFDLPAWGISNPEGSRRGTFSYTKRYCRSLETCGGFGKTEGGRRHSPSTRVFLSLSHLVPSATDPGGLSLPSLALSLSLSLFLSSSRSSVCLSTARHTFPTCAHCLAPPSQHWGPVLWWTRVQDSNWEGNKIDPTKTVTTLNRKPCSDDELTNWLIW